MPELPEVETTKEGISPHIVGQTLREIIIRQPSLRWPISPEVEELRDHTISAVTRRAKYILASVEGPTHTGTLIIHLGMSGSLRVIDPGADLRKHDHVLITLANGLQLRFHDPRRFGCIIFTKDPVAEHQLIKNLGPEPLSETFNADMLAAACASKSAAIKQVIMDGKVVVGVGNIYACEALHASGISPKRAANRISKTRLAKLVEEIKKVLQRSITQGGTTLRDFLREDGTAGYFKQQLHVYDRESEPCNCCPGQIKRIVQAQRSTFYCPRCQR